MTEKFFVQTPSLIATFEGRGCFRKEQYEKIKDISNNMLTEFMEVHYTLGQKENVCLTNLSWFAKFANEHLKDLYQDKVLKRLGTKYEDLNKDISKINNSDMTSDEKNKAIKEYSGNLTRLLENIVNEKVNDKKRKTKRLEGNNK